MKLIQFSLESADSSIKFWSPLNNFFCDLRRCHFVLCYWISALLVFLHNFVKNNLEIVVVFPLFTEYSSLLWQYVSLKHHLRIEMHFERNYQELWRNHTETKPPNDGVVYDEFLFIRESMKLTQTSHRLDLEIRFFSFFFVFV